MRSSTSLTPAPGISTKTSAKGTTICGSSSRGVASTAKRPEQQRGQDDELGELGVDEGPREAPRESERSGHGPASTRAAIGHPLGALHDDALAGIEPGEDLHPVGLARPHRHQPEPRHPAVVHHVEAGELAPLDEGRRRHQQRLTLPGGEASAAEEARAQRRVRGEIELHRHRPARRVGRRERSRPRGPPASARARRARPATGWRRRTCPMADSPTSASSR